MPNDGPQPMTTQPALNYPTVQGPKPTPQMPAQGYPATANTPAQRNIHPQAKFTLFHSDNPKIALTGNMQVRAELVPWLCNVLQTTPPDERGNVVLSMIAFHNTSRNGLNYFGGYISEKPEDPHSRPPQTAMAPNRQWQAPPFTQSQQPGNAPF